MIIQTQQKRALILAWVPVLILPLAMLGFSGPCSNLHGLGGAVWVFAIAAGCMLSEIRVIRLFARSSSPSDKRGWAICGISLLPILPVVLISGFFLLMTAIEAPIILWYALKSL